MAQLDKLLGAMNTNHASALVLGDGDVVKLEIGGQLRPLTKTPLSEAQILALLQEIAEPASLAKIAANQPVEILRATTDGAFVVRGEQSNGKWRIVVSLGKHEPASSPANPAPDATPGRRATVAGVATPAGAIHAASVPAAAPVATPAPAPAVAVTREEGEGPDLEVIKPFEGAPALRAQLDALMAIMIKSGASDLHLRVGEPPLLRLHGEMERIHDQPVLDDKTLSGMLKSIMPERNRIEYRANWDTDWAYEIVGLARFRCNAAKDRNGAVAVFRQIPAKVYSVEDMNVTEEVQRLCFLTKGLVLVTGPTGSGKSTTLCALIDLVNRERTDHVITIEDPIEFVHPNKKCVMTQRQVGVHTKTFKSALRAALREDPDIVLVGEMRDLETVSIAIETAETGHLVFGTLHTTTAAGTVDRIIDQFPADRQEQIRVMLAESLKGVISQTLCKKIGGGRVAAREILLSMPSITNLIREGKTFQIPSVLQTSRRIGMTTLNDALMVYVEGGQVEPKEAYMKCIDKTGLVMAMKKAGIDVSFAETDENAAKHAAATPAAGPPAGAHTPASPAAKPALAAKR
jgi:twitching motility protein PilT